MSTQCQILMKMKPFSGVAAHLTRAFLPTVVLGVTDLALGQQRAFGSPYSLLDCMRLAQHIEVVEALFLEVEEMRPRPQKKSLQGMLKYLREKDNFGLLEEVISTV
nr:hypothetical protein Itr_chr12CG18500 [Ipomoea trifida]